MILYLELIENITVVSPEACCNLEVVSCQGTMESNSYKKNENKKKNMSRSWDCLGGLIEVFHDLRV